MGRGVRSCVSDNDTTNNVETCHGASRTPRKMTISQATREYIVKHQHDDVRELALKGCQNPDVDLSFALQQIQGRQKAKGKLPEMYENSDIIFPPSVSMEQCSSETTAKYKAGLVHGDSFADLTGGFGVDTLAFAKCFQQGFYVELSKELCEVFEHNANALGIRNIQIQQGTMEEILPTLPEVDIFYLDPSRRDEHGRRVVSLDDCTPNVPMNKDALLGKARKGVLVSCRRCWTLRLHCSSCQKQKEYM